MAVDYTKNPDGTVVESRTVSSGKLSERLVEIGKLLEYNNTWVAGMTAEAESLEAQALKLRTTIAASTHTATIIELEDEKSKIEAVLK